jgi:CheY-like chemotaxis protein
MHLAGEPLPVRVDPGQLEQALIALAVNAREAMPKGGRFTIETAVAEWGEPQETPRQGLCAQLTVSDTGPGMSAETLGRLFEPFFSTKGEGRARGLGLCSVYSTVRRSGGEIRATSSYGQGSTFRIRLPKLPGPLPPAQKQTSSVFLRAHGRAILLVEDDEEVRELVRDMLVLNNFSPLCAGSAAEALLISQGYTGPIDILITDVVMPQTGGVELATRLAGFRPNLRVLFTSGYAEDIIADGALTTFPYAFLQKPFTVEALLQKIREVLETFAPHSA